MGHLYQIGSVGPRTDPMLEAHTLLGAIAALVAEYADACNIFGDVQTVRRKLAILERHCEEMGRDPAGITTTRLDGLIFNLPNAHELDPVELAGRTLTSP